MVLKTISPGCGVGLSLMLFLSPAGPPHSVCVCVSVCVTFLRRAVHHTGCFSLAFSMFYDLIAYVFSFDAVISDLGP